MIWYVNDGKVELFLQSRGAGQGKRVRVEDVYARLAGQTTGGIRPGA